MAQNITFQTIPTFFEKKRTRPQNKNGFRTPADIEEHRDTSRYIEVGPPRTSRNIEIHRGTSRSDPENTTLKVLTHCWTPEPTFHSFPTNTWETCCFTGKTLTLTFFARHHYLTDVFARHQHLKPGAACLPGAAPRTHISGWRCAQNPTAA